MGFHTRHCSSCKMFTCALSSPATWLLQPCQQRGKATRQTYSCASDPIPNATPTDFGESLVAQATLAKTEPIWSRLRCYQPHRELEMLQIECSSQILNLKRGSSPLLACKSLRKFGTLSHTIESTMYQSGVVNGSNRTNTKKNFSV